MLAQFVFAFIVIVYKYFDNLTVLGKKNEILDKFAKFICWILQISNSPVNSKYQVTLNVLQKKCVLTIKVGYRCTEDFLYSVCANVLKILLVRQRPTLAHNLQIYNSSCTYAQMSYFCTDKRQRAIFTIICCILTKQALLETKLSWPNQFLREHRRVILAIYHSFYLCHYQTYQNCKNGYLLQIS